MKFHDKIAEFFGNIIKDVRQHVLEESWYGKILIPDFSRNGESTDLPTRSFAEQLGWDRTSEHKTPEHENEHAIDR